MQREWVFGSLKSPPVNGTVKINQFDVGVSAWSGLMWASVQSSSCHVHAAWLVGSTVERSQTWSPVASMYARLWRYFARSCRQLQAICWRPESYLKLWVRKHWCQTLIVLNGLHTVRFICFYVFRWWSTSAKWWQPKKRIKNEYNVDARKRYACRNVAFLPGPRTVSLNYWYLCHTTGLPMPKKCNGRVLLRSVTQTKVQADSRA